MLLIWILACDDTIFANGTGGEAVTGDTYEDVETVFANNCTSCHNPTGAATFGGLDLQTDPCAATVRVSSSYGPPRVDPGNHADSVLWNKMADTGAYGGVMPPSGKLPDPTIASVAAWIDAGAPSPCSDSGGDDTDTGTDTGTAAAASMAPRAPSPLPSPLAGPAAAGVAL
jgi:hypothetical protein